MEKGWIKIYESSDVLLLEMMRQKLENAGIYTILLNKVDSAYTVFGRAELYVHESNKNTAEDIMKMDIDG